ncbi:MAG: DUF3124 domain-containing protein [Desulfobacterota bacterium]|jgi:hypothetical protein|nr:DUF3124 domain-containing protein [Thermodesulfobacteriota bacterium]
MRAIRFRSSILVLVFLLLSGGIFTSPSPAQTLSQGQLVYVPIYSHIYYGDQERAILLTGTLSVRNTDPTQPITLLQADYYDNDGKLIRKYITQPVTLGPLGSTRYIVKASDTAGGSGANFLVRWKAAAPANEPIMEGVMIGTSMGQGISFSSRGVALKEK